MARTVFVCLALFACGEGDDDVGSSRRGETCSKTADCAGGLRCVDAVCGGQVAGTDAGGGAVDEGPCSDWVRVQDDAADMVARCGGTGLPRVCSDAPAWRPQDHPCCQRDHDAYVMQLVQVDWRNAPCDERPTTCVESSCLSKAVGFCVLCAAGDDHQDCRTSLCDDD